VKALLQIAAILLAASVVYAAERPKYISEMGIFQAAREIDWRAKRYQITTEEVQRFDAMLETKGWTWDDFSIDEVQVVIYATRNNSTGSSADRKKLEADASKWREQEQEKKDREAREKQAADERAAKAKAQQAGKDKAQLEADMRLLSWQQRQASNGSASAECSLGIRYATGKGVTTNYALALYWLSMSSAQDNTEARRALRRLTNGLPVSSSPAGGRR